MIQQFCAWSCYVECSRFLHDRSPMNDLLLNDQQELNVVFDYGNLPDVLLILMSAAQYKTHLLTIEINRNRFVLLFRNWFVTMDTYWSACNIIKFKMVMNRVCLFSSAFRHELKCTILKCWIIPNNVKNKNKDLIVILLLVSRCYIYVIYKFLNFEANYAYISNTCNVRLASALTHLKIISRGERVANRFPNNIYIDDCFPRLPTPAHRIDCIWAIGEKPGKQSLT